MEIEEVPTRRYTGTGTAARSGIHRRFRDYELDVNIPPKVRESLDSGFEITQHGVIFSTAKPPPADAILRRALPRPFEAMFIYTFWSVYSVRTATQRRYIMEGICPWDRHSLEWRGLNVQNPLMEGVGHQTYLTPEEKT